MKVCKWQCSNCLFSKNKIVSEKRKAEILKDCIRKQGYFACHNASYLGRDVCCRGYYDLYGHYSQLVRICERMGGIDFVKMPEIKDLTSEQIAELKKIKGRLPADPMEAINQ